MSAQHRHPGGRRTAGYSALAALAIVATVVTIALVNPGLIGAWAGTLTGAHPTKSATAAPSPTPKRQTAAPAPVTCTPPAGSTASSQPATPANAPARRMINVGFEDIDSTDPTLLTRVNDRLNEVNANAVYIATGRMDWIGFPWVGHESDEASTVQDTGQDLVAKGLSALSCDASGHKRWVVLGIDTLLGRDLTKEPQYAGHAADGTVSNLFGSITGWTEPGGLGDRLADMVHETAVRYHPDAINVTELFFDTETFGADDLANFTSVTGETSWPRNADGSINVSTPSMEKWRNGAMSIVLKKVAAAVAGTGVQLSMDVREPVAANLLSRPDIGQDYPNLLKYVDEIAVWDFPAFSSTNAFNSEELGDLLVAKNPDRYSLEIGVWQDAGTISPDVLAKELAGAAKSGIKSVSVTTESVMTEALWQVVKDAWTVPKGSE